MIFIITIFLIMSLLISCTSESLRSAILFHFGIITRLERILLVKIDKGDDLTKRKEHPTQARPLVDSIFLTFDIDAGNLIDRGEREKERGIIALIRPWPLEAVSREIALSLPLFSCVLRLNDNKICRLEERGLIQISIENWIVYFRNFTIVVDPFWNTWNSL